MHLTRAVVTLSVRLDLNRGESDHWQSPDRPGGDNGEDTRNMRRGLLSRGVLAVAAAIALSGAGVLSFSSVASAATGSVTVTPSTGLQPQGTTTVSVSGSGFAAGSPGAILQCNDYGISPGGVAATPAQPTISLAGDASTRVLRATPARAGGASNFTHDERDRNPWTHRLYGEYGHDRPTDDRHRLGRHTTRRPTRPTTPALQHRRSKRPERRVSLPSVTSPAMRRRLPFRSPEPVSLPQTPPATTWSPRTEESSTTAPCPSAARPVD